MPIVTGQCDQYQSVAGTEEIAQGTALHFLSILDVCFQNAFAAQTTIRRIKLPEL